MTHRPHRRVMVLRGPRALTAARALALVGGLPAEECVWVSTGDPSVELAAHGVQAVPARRLGRHLGRSCTALVLDLHEGLDADVLGQAQGMVRGGGRLLLRLPAWGEEAPRDPAHVVWPHTLEEVGDRLWRRLLARLDDSGAVVPPASVAPVGAPEGGTAEQAAVVETLVAAWRGGEASSEVLLADRGRGKSAALGLALRALLETEEREVLVSAGRATQAAEVLRFAVDDPLKQGLIARGERVALGKGHLRFLPLHRLLQGELSELADVLVLDEAARIPLPTLQRLTLAHPDAHLAFATTTAGYEGTGRGFVLRFLDWLSEQGRPPRLHHLVEPIRWGLGDPVERLVQGLLCLDAGPAHLAVRTLAEAHPGSVRHEVLDREALAADEALLREVFGLLIHAHYRTTPSDLGRLLDAPNLRVHVLRHADSVVAASLVAVEGRLPSELLHAAAAGRTRLRGHALADTLVTHAGRPEAGSLSMWRSMRIAVHPRLRRRGLGSHLAERIESLAHAEGVALLGTLFGATPELLSFRRNLGYRLVRVGGSRGERTGAPAAVMVRPLSMLAAELVVDLREVLGRNLPLQLRLMEADGELGLDEPLRDALLEDLPDPHPWSAPALHHEVMGYLDGPRTQDSVAHALRTWVHQHRHLLPRLDPRERTLVEARVVRLGSWRACTRLIGLDSVRATQRLLRRSLRELAADQLGLPG